MMPSPYACRGRAGERGTITLWVLGLCIALMFLGGLSLDLWRAVAERRQLSSMADSAATAAANGVDVQALRAGTLRLDPVRARAIALASLDEDAHSTLLDGVDVAVVGNRVTVTLRDHVRFSLLGVFMGGRQFDIEVHASAQPEERP
jgi:Flp pilus assembly protein TadG